MERARNQQLNTEPVLIAGEDKCPICGERVKVGYPVHKKCIDEQKDNQHILNESSIQSFEFWSYEKLKAFFDAQGHEQRCWAQAKKSRCVFTINKKQTQLTAAILVDASIYVCAFWRDDYSELGYERLKKKAEEYKHDLAMCFIV